MNTNLRPLQLVNANQADRPSLMIRYLVEDFGAPDWELAPWQPVRRATAGSSPVGFGLDEAGLRRLHALAGLLEMSQAEIEQWYAEYWLTYTVLAAYAQPLHATGWRLVQLLAGLDGLTQRARTLMPRLKLPGLECFEVCGNGLVMRLREGRPRGERFLQGMLRRLAMDFGMAAELSPAPSYGPTAVRVTLLTLDSRSGWEDMPELVPQPPASTAAPVRQWRAPMTLRMPSRSTPQLAVAA